ncbi:MAG: hypothetical protein VKJ02_06125 [Snowella sp.]|nr:hypothetical protein [Snowella sp.]
MDEQLLKSELERIVTLVNTVASKCDKESDRLLALLRTLEELHRQIRVEQFEPYLPNTRKDLYALLRDIEESGGWPYIERGKLQTFTQWLITEETDSTPDKENEVEW